ncbi:hypothetical protein [Winogradskyella sediminis]|uniref:Uncharacterized protein n=1 Tax=Winogradskyella sediminis TaxID=1382466 RepID=A0A1H1LY49_9FLAO|nr:hypothetical protein [Winogradskyella sediminis]REG86040.1 hypothetical protein C8N41_103136 [Winogradskyella sediminis]SDR78975.1 hypothetical protein SAMN04489797_0127 [Winogradskyella sediminis]
MNDYLHNTIPNLKPFNYEHHHDALFINKPWVLVNGISKKKSVYTFKEDNILEISRKNNVITTSWSINIQNVLSIETEDGKITVSAFFKDDDILVLNNQSKEEFAMYINATNYEDDINSVEDIQAFLKDKYKKKVSTIIYDHEFYYIEKSEEFGPFKVEVLAEKVNSGEISAFCFVRDVNEHDYSNRMRIEDLLHEL